MRDVRGQAYDDPVFVGVVQIGTNCGPNAMTWNMVVASPADESFTGVVQVKTADADELRTICSRSTLPGHRPGTEHHHDDNAPRPRSLDDDAATATSTTTG